MQEWFEEIKKGMVEIGVMEDILKDTILRRIIQNFKAFQERS